METSTQGHSEKRRPDILVKASVNGYNSNHSQRGVVLDDRELLKAIARGDRDALEEFLSRYERRLSAYLRRFLDNQADVDETFWEVVVAVWQGASRYRGQAEPCYWILTIARNKAYRKSRRARRSATEDLNPNTASRSGSLDERLAVESALRRLDPAERELLILRYCLEYTSSEIATITGLIPVTVRGRLLRARRKLRRILAPERNPDE